MDSGLKSEVKIADDTIAMIAGIAATSVEGVSSLGEGVTFKALPHIGSNSLKKGIAITKDDTSENLIINMSIVIKQGADIKKTCMSIQEKVKESIEQMLDKKVLEVSVRVAKVDDV